MEEFSKSDKDNRYKITFEGDVPVQQMFEDLKSIAQLDTKTFKKLLDIADADPHEFMLIFVGDHTIEIDFTAKATKMAIMFVKKEQVDKGNTGDNNLTY